MKKGLITESAEIAGSEGEGRTVFDIIRDKCKYPEPRIEEHNNYGGSNKTLKNVKTHNTRNVNPNNNDIASPTIAATTPVGSPLETRTEKCILPLSFSAPNSFIQLLL